jgi:hypothetical protein
MKPPLCQFLTAARIGGRGRFATPAFKTWEWFCRKIALSSLLIAMAGTGGASEPVPAELENATPEARRKQMEAAEQKDLDSFIHKSQEGQSRNHERQELKHAIVTDLKRDVMEKQREMEVILYQGNRPVPDSTTTLLVKSTTPILGLIVIAYGFMLWRVFLKRKLGWTHYPLGVRKPPLRLWKYVPRRINRRGSSKR